MKSVLKDLQHSLPLGIAVPMLMLVIGITVLLFKEGAGRNSLQAKQTSQATVSCFGGDLDDKWDLWEMSLQGEILSSNGPDEIFTLFRFPGFYPGENEIKIVRIRGDRAIMTWHEDKARELYRELTRNELEELRSFIKNHSIDDLGQVDDDCGSPKCLIPYSYLHLKRGGEVSRAWMSIAVIGDHGKPYHKLIELFYRFTLFGEFKACYKMRDKFKGLEVLLTSWSWSPERLSGSWLYARQDEKKSVVGVCKSGDSIRVLLQTYGSNFNDPKIEWRDFTQGSLGDKLEPQTACPALYKKNNPPSNLESYLPPTNQGGDAMAEALAEGTVENLVSGSDQPDPKTMTETMAMLNEMMQRAMRGNEALARSLSPETREAIKNGALKPEHLKDISRALNRNRSARNQRLSKLTYYSHYAITPDGKWIVAAKSKGVAIQFVRISTETRREYKIKSPYIFSVEKITPVPSRNKMLAVIQSVRGKREPQTEYYLIDSMTGASEKVTGDFRPLTPSTFYPFKTFRPLQPTGRPNEFWAAVADRRERVTEIGRYDTRKFVFNPTINLPLVFNEVWVDEAEGKIYVVYNGHLLRLPLKQ
ncbi:MAG: hypothetical protein ACREBD_30505 [Blastocatellia bacterium]